MKNNPVKQLGTFGQSIGLDYVRRDLIASAKRACQIYKEIFGAMQFKNLAEDGARVRAQGHARPAR